MPWPRAFRWNPFGGLAPDGAEVLEIPPGPGSRPGERVVVPSPSIHPPRRPGLDGSREDFRVVVGTRSTFAAVCLGPTADRGAPLAASHFTLEVLQRRRMTVDERPTAVQVAGEAAYRYRLRHGDLTEWKFEHGGWLYVTGLLRRPVDPVSAVRGHADAIHDSWVWLDAGPPPRPAAPSQ